MASGSIIKAMASAAEPRSSSHDGSELVSSRWPSTAPDVSRTTMRACQPSPGCSTYPSIDRSACGSATSA